MSGVPVQYARSGGVSLAYQSWGERSPNLLAIPPMAQNIELTWERPEYRHMFARMGSFARFVHFDKRGTGASDRTQGIPTLDERVEEVRAVLDAADIDRAFLLGVSEGGPAAILFAVTYPERVQGMILHSAAARFAADDEAADVTATRLAWWEAWLRSWGTDATITLSRFAPSMAADRAYSAWQPRYERQSASPAAMAELLQMVGAIDVRPLLGSISVPTLVLHRRGDQVCPIGLGRELAGAIPSAHFVELEGADHFSQVGDADGWLDEVERFVTGSAVERRRRTSVQAESPRVCLMGGFRVEVDGHEVPLKTWGSRRARQLLKRLAVAVGQPVPRDELADLLWPDDPAVDRLGARLSVVLSTVRRVLGGGLIADTAAVRLDLCAVRLGLDAFYAALAAGDDQRAVELYTGDLLPEDAYEDWVVTSGRRLREAVIGAHRRLATTAASTGHPGEAADHAAAMLELDGYDERGHELLVGSLLAAGREGDARRAERRYRRAMEELGVRPQFLLGDTHRKVI